MIARVHFIGIVYDRRKKLATRDYVDFHVAASEDAEQIFKGWVKLGCTIRGGKSGVWHPQDQYGEVRFERVEEREE